MRVMLSASAATSEARIEARGTSASMDISGEKLLSASLFVNTESPRMGADIRLVRTKVTAMTRITPMHIRNKKSRSDSTIMGRTSLTLRSAPTTKNLPPGEVKGRSTVRATRPNSSSVHWANTGFFVLKASSVSGLGERYSHIGES